MSEIVNDLKLSNLEISEESGIRLTSQNPTIKHTRDNNTSSTLSISSDGILSLTGTSVSVNGAITLSNALIASVETSLTGGTTAVPFPVSTSTYITTLNVNANDKHVKLADGTPGQVKIITAISVSSGHETTLSFDTSFVEDQKILFNAVGESVTLLFTLTGWVIISLSGATIV